MFAALLITGPRARRAMPTDQQLLSPALDCQLAQTAGPRSSTNAYVLTNNAKIHPVASSINDRISWENFGAHGNAKACVVSSAGMVHSAALDRAREYRRTYVHTLEPRITALRQEWQASLKD